MNIKAIVMVLAVTIGSLAMVSAQAKTAEIKTTIYCSHCQQCETCGQRFDTELFKLKGLKHYEVDSQKGIIKVVYNSTKLDIGTIRQRIAECGYDADEVKATEDGLNSLDGCCRRRW